MEDVGIGWLAAIFIGAVAGLLAEKLMQRGAGQVVNALLGVAGAVAANFILALLGVVYPGWFGYLAVGFVGACILIVVWWAIKWAARRR